MDKLKNPYQKPTLIEVNLVPEEATLCVCKTQEDAGTIAMNFMYCGSWGWWVGMGSPCKDTIGS